LLGACDSLLEMLRAKPQRLLLWMLGLYGALWFASAISFGGLPAAGTDMLVYGHEWQWGYAPFPPLVPWLADLAFGLTGHWTGSQLVLSIGSVLLTLLLVWQLGVATVGASGAALAVALTISIQYFGAQITAYDPATGTLPLWIASVLLYRRVVLSPGRIGWAMLGVVLALLIYANQAGVLLIAVLAGHLLLTRQGRSQIGGAGPAIAAGVAVVLLLPHLIWLFGAPAATAADAGFGARIATAFGFLFGHAALHIGMMLIVLLAVLPGLPLRSEPLTLDLTAPTPFDRSLILAAAIVPWLLTAAAPLVGIAISPYAGGAMVALSGLALIVALPSRLVLRAPRLAAAVWALLLVAQPFGHAVSVYAKASGSGPLPTELYPARALSNAMQSVWKSRTTRPLDIVTGSLRQAGYVALYATPRPSVLIDADLATSPWITRERLKQSGTLVVWTTDEFRRTDELPAPYRAALGTATPVFGTMVLPLGGGKLKAYGWAMILPDGATPIAPPQPTAPPPQGAPSPAPAPPPQPPAAVEPAAPAPAAEPASPPPVQPPE
jgi:4-amino-4-deoxy-L-arabinose transferase-like glycosyltransferase